MPQATIVRVGSALTMLALAGCAVPAARHAAADGAHLSPAIPAGRPLLGSTPGMLDAWFGQPELRRVDGPAQVWLYRTATCGLDLVLYPDGGGVPRVAMATATAGSPVVRFCAHSLAQAHLGAKPGPALEQAAAS